MIKSNYKKPTPNIIIGNKLNAECPPPNIRNKKTRTFTLAPSIQPWFLRSCRAFRLEKEKLILLERRKTIYSQMTILLDRKF